MRQLSLSVIAGTLASLFAATGAFADHMTGQYSGTGEAAGTFLDLRQSGTSLQGDISGDEQGTLTGQTDGGDNAFGTINLSGSAPLPFRATWSQGTLTFQFQGMSEVLTFTAGAAAADQQAPEPPAASAEYYVAADGGQVGPLTLEELVGRIESGETTGADLVWMPGAAEWAAAETFQELQEALASEGALAAADYYIEDNGQQVGPLTLEELIARIRAGTTGPEQLVWTSGMAAWTPAGDVEQLAEAFAAVPPPVPAVEEEAPPPLPPAEAAPETPPPLPAPEGGG
jgi:hypothetical protein